MGSQCFPAVRSGFVSSKSFCKSLFSVHKDRPGPREDWGCSREPRVSGLTVPGSEVWTGLGGFGEPDFGPSLGSDPSVSTTGPE